MRIFSIFSLVFSEFLCCINRGLCLWFLLGYYWYILKFSSFSIGFLFFTSSYKQAFAFVFCCDYVLDEAGNNASGESSCPSKTVDQFCWNNILSLVCSWMFLFWLLISICEQVCSKQDLHGVNLCVIDSRFVFDIIINPYRPVF